MLTPVPVRVQEKGQVTLPRAVREKLKLKKGDLVTFVETPEGIVIKPAAIVANEALNEIGAALKAKGIKLEDLLERGREIRSELAPGKVWPVQAQGMIRFLSTPACCFQRLIPQKVTHATFSPWPQRSSRGWAWW